MIYTPELLAPASPAAASSPMAEPPQDDSGVAPDLEQLPGLITRSAYELNLYLRCASLAGIHVQVDLVERENVAHPGGYTEVLVQAEGAGTP